MKKLDDHQMVSLVQQLIDERDALLKRQEHLVSLSKLWEKTIAEAEIIAEQVKEDARKQADEEKNKILEEARAAADKRLNDHISSSDNQAKEGVLSVKQKLQQEFSAISEESLKSFETRLAEIADHINTTCASELDTLKKQSDAFRKELEEKFAGFEIQGFPPTETLNPPVIQANNPGTDPVNTTNATDNTISMQNLPEREANDIREQRIIEILPPRDKERIDYVRNHLNFLEEVIQTEIQHLVDRTFIVVALSKHLDLAQMMSEWSEVERAQEVVVENQTRIQISLGVEKEIAQEKDRLTSKISRFTRFKSR
jgi:vacuolar-type H+-ATPase subunit E/Vma4